MADIKAIIKRGLRYIIKGVPVKRVTVKIVTLPPNDLLSGRCALVTGGTSGIGKEIARAFLTAGASVIIIGRTDEKVNKVVEELKLSTNGTVYGWAMNIDDVPKIEENFVKIQSLVGRNIDILVNSAGVFDSHSFGDTTEQEYDLVLNTNLKGVYFLSQLFSKKLIEDECEGNILNIASSSGFRPANSPYALSKWGIRGLTVGLARVLTPKGITVNGIAPGPTATPMLNVSNNHISHERNLTGRHATPEEIAQMAVVLVSNLGKMIVGDVVCMSGGAGNVTNEDITFSLG